MIRRFHKWMLHHCQWWVYTRADVARISRHYMYKEELIRQAEVARYAMYLAADQEELWRERKRKAKAERAEAEHALKQLVRKDNDD